MNYSKYMGFVLSALCLAACSEPERAMAPSGTGAGESELLLQHAGPLEGVSVFAFRRTEDRFLYDTLFRGNWDTQGRMSVRMRNGDYKFLFTEGAGAALKLMPEPLTKQTAWEEAVYALQPDASGAGYSLPADELFLQSPAAVAETVYTVQGERQTVSARLTRAVGRVDVVLKRGYKNGDTYIEVPYTAPHHILEQVAGLELEIDGVGSQLTAAGSTGTAKTRVRFDAASDAELTDEGFARFEGPFVVPPAGGTPVQVDVKVTPAAGSPVPAAQVGVAGTVERNQRLEVTLWITSDYPTFDVEVRLTPITDEQDGDTGVWE